MCLVKSDLKDKFNVESVYSDIDKNHNLNIGIINIQNNYILIIVYKSPHYNNDKLICKLNELISQYINIKNVIILGDFNIDLITQRNNKIVTLLQDTFRLNNCLDKGTFTTNNKTCIDWLFSNISKKIFSQIYHVTYSYHNPIYMEILQDNDLNEVPSNFSDSKMNEIRKPLKRRSDLIHADCDSKRSKIEKDSNLPFTT